MVDTKLTWPEPRGGTSFSGAYLQTPWSFAETVARLIALSGQDPTQFTDEYKVSVEFGGTFDGQVFTLYDYKGDDTLHVGALDGRLDVAGLNAYLIDALTAVQPSPFTALIQYDDDRRRYGWPE